MRSFLLVIPLFLPVALLLMLALFFQLTFLLMLPLTFFLFLGMLLLGLLLDLRAFMLPLFE